MFLQAMKGICAGGKCMPFSRYPGFLLRTLLIRQYDGAAGSSRCGLHRRAASKRKRATEAFMPTIESRINPNSETFRANREQMLALIGDFRALEQKVRDFSNARRDRF